MNREAPIGIFDSGYGGLSVFKEIQEQLPEYSYIYLGDNARAPYGTRSFSEIFDFTLQAVEFLFQKGCQLVILACNTASAQALRTIQQNYLPKHFPDRRVLGVIRPCTELIGEFAPSGHLAILGTEATVNSNSYGIEAKKFSPATKVTQWPCLQWVSLVEAGLSNRLKMNQIIKADLERILRHDPKTEAIVLACTHFSLLESVILKHLPSHIRVIHQGPVIAKALEIYLQKHHKLEKLCKKNKEVIFYTTGSEAKFRADAALFLKIDKKVEKVTLTSTN